MDMVVGYSGSVVDTDVVIGYFGSVVDTGGRGGWLFWKCGGYW